MWAEKERQVASEPPIVWCVHLSPPPAQVFDLLATDAGREQFWATRSAVRGNGFDLLFPGGIEAHVAILEMEAPGRLSILYFGAEVLIEINADDEGTVLTITDFGRDPGDYLDRYAGWVSWLLMLKARTNAGVDLRNHRSDRAWAQRFVDQ